MDLRRRLLSSAALAALSVAVAASFGRVFASSAYLWPLVGAAIAPHALGVVFRARRVPGFLLPVASAVALAGYVVWGLLLHTTSHGIPGHATLQELGNRLDAGWAVLRHDQAPVVASAGVVLLAVLAIWVMAQIADIVAFDVDASLGALAPAVTMFIWLCALGTGSGATASTLAVGITAAMFLAVQHLVGLDRRRTVVGAGRVVAAPALLSAAAVTALGALLLAVVVVPELPGAGAGPIVDLHELGRSDPSPSYRTSVAPLIDVGAKLRRSAPEELFTVRSPVPDYWRITALDDYRDEGGGQWTLSAVGDDAISEGLDGSAPPGAVTQQYTIGPLDERWMPAAYRPVSVSRSDTLVVRASSTLVTGASSVSGLRYEVVSALPRTGISPAQQAATARPVPAGLLRYTDLPGDFPQMLKDKALQITDGATNPYEKAKALRDFFRTGFSYDPTVDLGDDKAALATFVLTTKSGFCVQFASAYATMARAVGIPARVAVGFTPGILDEQAGVFRVGTDDAHAWPEIWLAGLGWTHLFDPTPPSQEGSAGGSALPNEQSTDPPVGVNSRGEPVPTTTGPGTTATSTPDATPGASTPVAPQPVEVRAPDHGGGGTSVVAAIAVVLGALLVVALAIAIGIVVAKLRRRAARRGRPEPAAVVRGAWEEALDHLRDHGFTPPPGATPLEIAARAPVDVGAATAAPMHALAGAHSAACYGAHEPDADEVARVWLELDALDAALDATFGGPLAPLQRARRKLDPGSLRDARQPVPAGWSTAERNPATKD
jgi:transglutaminase-like putative cysteine protease